QAGLADSSQPPSLLFFIGNTATAEIYTLSLHDALPISGLRQHHPRRHRGLHCGRGRLGTSQLPVVSRWLRHRWPNKSPALSQSRSEEHTSELQSRSDLVCRLLLEKKK